MGHNSDDSISTIPAPASQVPAAPSTVFIVDDDQALRDSLRFLFESVGLRVETHASAHEFLASYHPDRPGCVILDVRMPGMSGLELQEHLNSASCLLPVVIISAFGDVPLTVRAMKAGAIHVYKKPISDHDLLELIQRAIAEDQRRRQSRAALQEIRDRYETLTDREKEVMEEVVEGKSSKEIGVDLEVSFKTVEAHRAKIMKKMEADSIPHLIRMWYSIKSEGEEGGPPPANGAN